MKQTNIFLFTLLVAVLLASCKKPEDVDHYNPNNYYNQPPLGKDTVWGTASYISLVGGYFNVQLTDDATGQAFNLDAGKSFSDYGHCYLLSDSVFGPQSAFSATNIANERILIMSHPKPMKLAEVDIPGSIDAKYTLGVKK